MADENANEHLQELRRIRVALYLAVVVLALIALIVAANFWANSMRPPRREIMKREIIRVEPFDSNFEKWGVPVSTCTRAGDMIFISGLPPFDPKTGELLVNAPFEQQAERCLEELKTALEAAGSDLEHVLKVNVLCVSPERFKAFRNLQALLSPESASPHFLLRAGMDGPV
jgi:2-iminobutanoate/2-iminopropanoate deaminase